MKGHFIVSLCYNGILGGAITAEEESLVYRTGKVSVAKRLRHIEMRYADILSFEKGWIFCFPTVTLHMRDQQDYRYIVFGHERFCRLLQEKSGR